MALESAFPQALQRVAAFLRHLPGVGRRTAERHALALLDWPEELLRQLGAELAELKTNVLFCRVCGNLSDTDECAICKAVGRQKDTICVVEYPTQIPTIEASGSFRGLYHVLGGRIVPLEGKGPDDLRIAELRERLADGAVTELILATSPDVEGEATAHFLAAEFKDLPLQITRIATGVPVGADLSFADSATLAMAFNGRRSLE